MIRRTIASLCACVASFVPHHGPAIHKAPAPNLAWMDVTRAPDWPHWRTLGTCETGLRWTFRTRRNATNGEPLFQGAFAMAWSTWDWAARGALGRNAALFPRADWAPPFVQVHVARWARKHGAGWGCDR